MPIKRRITNSGEKLYFSPEVKRLRKEQGITQEAMAGKLNVSLKTLQNWENQKACPDTIESVFLLCDMLKCDIEYLFGLQSLPRRADADIYDETGLPLAAIESLRERRKNRRGPYYDSMMNFLTAIIIHGGYVGCEYSEYQKTKAEYAKSKEYYQQTRPQFEAIEMSEQEYIDNCQSKLREAKFKVLLAVADALQREG